MRSFRYDFLGIIDSKDLSDRKITVFSFEQVDSTNTLARQMITSGEASAPALFIANSQTSGRGRMGRSFFSPSDTGLYMSLALDITAFDISSVTRMTSAAAVAVCRAIKEILDKDPQIKWVNDLFLDGKKVCGILAESFFSADRRYAVIGIGINISTESFPCEIEQIAGSLGSDSAVRRELTITTVRNLFDILSAVQNGDVSYMNEYRAHSCVLGKTVDFTSCGITKTGVATVVDDDGALTVKLPDGSEELLSSGEISLRTR